ncbi:MAG: hypothetical protein ACHQ16_01360, partial [Candidatus Lutacidiplasmatales archaeon]
MPGSLSHRAFVEASARQQSWAGSIALAAILVASVLTVAPSALLAPAPAVHLPAHSASTPLHSSARALSPLLPTSPAPASAAAVTIPPAAG